MIECIIGRDSKNPEFAYPSARRTRRSETKRALDEVIHLASAKQLAGFRSVIGTMFSQESRSE